MCDLSPLSCMKCLWAPSPWRQERPPPPPQAPELAELRGRARRIGVWHLGREESTTETLQVGALLGGGQVGCSLGGRMEAVPPTPTSGFTAPGSGWGVARNRQWVLEKGAQFSLWKVLGHLHSAGPFSSYKGT